jgi:hypothetical protein
VKVDRRGYGEMERAGANENGMSAFSYPLVDTETVESVRPVALLYPDAIPTAIPAKAG